jgi:integrase
MRGLGRTRGTAQRHAEALTPVRLAPVLVGPPDRLIDLRDPALLLIGLAAALSRSELVTLTVEDLVEAHEGLRLIIRHAKTDQEGAGQVVAVHRTGRDTCPVAALAA